MIISSSQFSTLAATTTLPDQTIAQRIKTAYTKDPSLNAILAFLTNSPHHAPANIKKQFSSYTLANDLILFEGLIYIPNDDSIKTEILRSRHDSPTAGHPGQAKTLELMSRDYYWPQMRKFVNRYINGCDACRRTKPSHQGPHGFLQPLPIPSSRWTDISYDFITQLPPSSGHDAILVVIDRLTKMGHFIACDTTIDAEGTAALFRKHIWKLHGTPKHTVSDRGSVFNSKFLK